MASKTKTQTTFAGMTQSNDFFIVSLKMLVGNPYQPRLKSALPGCLAAGYPLWEANRKDAGDTNPEEYPAIWDLLMSNDPNKQAKAVGLIKEHDADIDELASGIAANGQLSSIGVSLADDDKPDAGLYVVFGMRRCIAIAYNHCRSSGELPLTVKAEYQRPEGLTDEHTLIFRAMSENQGRKNENIIEEAKRYKFMKTHLKMNNNEIAKRVGENPQNVYNRMLLLKCTPEEQEKVAAGRLGMVNAIKAMRAREEAAAEQKAAVKKAAQEGTPVPETESTPAPVVVAQEIPEKRKRTLTLKQMELLYAATEKPESLGEMEVTDEFWHLAKTADVRKFMALQIGKEYESYGEMTRRVKEAERAALALQAEEARKAAEKAEADEAEELARLDAE